MRTVLFIIFASFFIGCEKDPIPSIEGKWNLVKVSYKEYSNGTQFSNEWNVTGETMEFRPDGKVEVVDQSGSRISEYTISGYTITFLSITYQIQDLGENSATLLDHHVHDVGEYHDTYLHLSR